LSLWQTSKNNRPPEKDYPESTKEKMKKLPTKVELREQLKDIPVYDQGELGSSTACAMATAHRISAKKKAKFRYYKERNL
jgi:hypothetical protein